MNKKKQVHNSRLVSTSVRLTKEENEVVDKRAADLQVSKRYVFREMIRDLKEKMENESI